MFKDTSLLSLGLALAFVGILASGGVNNYKAMSEKADAQKAAVSEFLEWKRQYTKLLPVEKSWAEQFKASSTVKDLYSVVQLLGDKPRTNADTLLVDKIERFEYNGVDLHAQRVCLTSSGAQGVEFEEESFEPLVENLRQLISRPDVQVGSITFSSAKGKARAVASKLCVIVRDSEAGKK